MKTSRYALVASVVIIVGILFYRIPLPFAQNNIASEASLWVATIGQLFKLDANEGGIEARPANTSSIVRLVVDESDGTVWGYSKGNLSAYDQAGKLLTSTSVPQTPVASNHIALAIDNISGHVWLAIDKRLHHFSDQGQLLKTFTLEDEAQDLSFDPNTRKLWVATETTIKALDSTGAVIQTLALPKKSAVQAIAIDRGSSSLWVALGDSLRLYNNAGTQILQKSIKVLNRLADDGDHGVWAASGHRLLRISAAGQILVDSIPLLITIDSMTVDRADHSVWVGGLLLVRHVDAQGYNICTFTLLRILRDLALFISPTQGNRPPIATNDKAVTQPNAAVSVSVLANDADPDNDPLTITAFTQGSHGKVARTASFLTYTPASGFRGVDTFQYTISDGKGGMSTATVTVIVDRAPTITSTPPTTASVGQLYRYDVDATDPDPGDTVVFSLDSAPAGMIIDAVTGVIQWTPTSVQIGANNVSVRATDAAGLFAVQSFTVQVNAAPPANRAPSIISGPVTTATVSQLYVYDVDATDPDAGDILAYSLDVAPSGMTINSSSGVVQWTPTAAQTGANSVTVRVRDVGGLFATQSFSVQVNSPASGAPFFTSAPPTTAVVGQPYSYDADASDPEGDVLTFSLATAPAGMTINSVTGLIQWTPLGTQLEGNSVVVRVRDAGGLFATQAFIVQVNATPTLPPIITSTPVNSGSVGKSYSYNVTATDPDAGDIITYSLNGAPVGMTIDATTGAISWTPGITQTGAQNVTAIVSDGHGGTASQSFSVNVSSAQANRAPTAQDDQYAVRRGDTLSVAAPGVLQNDSDPDGQSLTSVLASSPTKGIFNFNADGSFNYTAAVPPPNSTEPVLKFSYRETIDPTVTSTLTQPLVVDLDGDGVAEIVFNSFGPFGHCRLIALHGNDGSVYFSANVFQPTANPPVVLCDPFSQLAAGDLDGDGFPEIIAVDGFDGSNPATDIFRRQLISFNHDGTHKWTSEDILTKDVRGGFGLLTSTSGMTSPVIADLDGDGIPEIVVGHSGRIASSPGVANEDFVTAFDSQGRILWTVRGGGSGGNSAGALVVQDIDLDGKPEILFSDDVYDSQGNLLRSAAACLTCLSVSDLAVANLDDDPFAEIVFLDRFGQVYVYEHTGALKWGPLDVGTADSLLTVGDVDGDGKAEIVVTSGTNIVVIAGNGSSTRSIPVPMSSGGPGGNTTIFDLNGDGKPELIHNGLRSSFDTNVGQGNQQTGAVYIFDGATGTLLHSIRAVRDGGTYSGLGPVVADVNGDGSAEIVTGGWNGSPLLHVFEGKNAPWARARPIYNQIHYNVTNVNSDGTIPAHPAPNWLTPGLNNFRVNIPLPEERIGDNDQFTYKANDGALDSNSAMVQIAILPPNHAPQILSQPPTVAAPNIEYLYGVLAFDADAGEILTFSLAQAPAGMTINAASGLVRWTPAGGQIGRQVVAVKVTDSQGQFAYQGFTIEVVGAVTVPGVIGQTQATAQTILAGAALIPGTIVTTPSNTVPAGQVISQGISAGTSVPAGAAVSLVISSGPLTATVPNVVGQTQAAAQSAISGRGLNIGTVTTAPSTTLAAGNIISQDPAAGTPVALGTGVNLIVSIGTINLTGLTAIVIQPVAAAILVGEEQAYSATGVFNDGTSQNLTGIVGWSSSAPTSATISPVGIAKGLTDGTTTIQASANSITGNATLTVRSRIADATLPNAAIVEPANNAEVTSPVDVVGNATDANFLKYRLEYAPAGETVFTLLNESTTPVANGVLGKFDPTLLINDQYTLRLTVFDRGGNTQQASVSVQVAREMKVGLFTVTFQDLNVAMSGLPITVNRTYDSRDKRKGDFGFGWRLSLQTMRVRANRVLGTGWVRGQSGAVINLSQTDAHKVTVTLPDGRIEEFDMQVSPTAGLGSLDFTNVVGFTPRAGTVGKLEALAENSLAILSAGTLDELVDINTLNTYNPQVYRYTTGEGTQIEIHVNEGIKKVTDLNGNTLTFGPNGITHSAGKGITFTRDSEGRITQIIDPAGNIRTYAYDANGDLISVADQVGNIARYKYNRTHGLIDIQDPAGNHSARNEYDAQGRLIATIDANGNRIEFTHDVIGAREVVRDRLSNVTVFEYDPAGNVTAKIDALGKRTIYTYDSQGNPLTETDPLGRIAQKTYDGRRNVLTHTDFDGNTTTKTYNVRNQVLRTTDPEGRITVNVYDAFGNLTQTTDPEGGVVRHSYDAVGNRLTTTDPVGNVTRRAYDSFGNKTSELDPLGMLTTFTYNSNSNVLSETKSGRTTQFQYDATLRRTKTIDALGQQIVTVYSSVADGKKPASVTDVRGQLTNFEYDARGDLIRTTFPDGSTTTTTYDNEGRALSKSDRDGRHMAFQYDALGRQTRITNPDGTTVNKTYDAVARLLTQTDERGNVTTYAYGPNKQTVFDALGNVTVHDFDSRERRTRTTDALGRITAFAYDSKGKLTRTIFPDGSNKITSYDTAGRKVGETDQAGLTTQFAYDAVGRLIRVTDSAGVTSYTYDALGNRVTQTDANGHTTQMTYDVLGRVTRRSRPLGQFETFGYDAGGNQVSHTDFNGQTTTFAYDSNNRQIRRTLPGGTIVASAYMPGGPRTQAGGDTSTYDARGRLIQDNKASGVVLIYTYDPAGNRSSVTAPQGTTSHTYDALNRLSAVVEASGTTTYVYDAVGNLVSTAYPNSVTTSYSYDALNRLVQTTNTGPSGLISSYTYTLGPAGNRLRVVEAGPATTGRTVIYVYDALYRLTQEQIDEPGTINDQAITYSYDAVGNRMQMNRNGIITTYSYDANDRLLTEANIAGTFVSTYDNNGNLKTRGNGASTDSYIYDGENRLISANVQTGTSPGLVAYTYDADGMRNSKATGGIVTTFLLDKNRDHAQVLVETTGSTIVTYAYGHDLISQTRSGIGTRFYQYDGQLSTRQLTDTIGTVTDTYNYDAFGVLLAAVGATPNLYLYTGQQLDPNVGFYYLRARYYAQAQGRFITTDPENGTIFDPASLHRYLYANGNPITFADPSGRFVQGLVAAVGTIAIADALIGAFSSGVTFLIVKGVPTDLKSAAEFGVEVIAGAIGGGVSAIPLIGPAIAGFIAVMKQVFVLHYIARKDVFAYDVFGSVVLNVFVGGAIGIGLQGVTGNVGQAAFQGGLSTSTDKILRWVGGMIAVAQGSNSGNAETFLSEGFVGGKGEVFWCAADSYPQSRTACPNQK